MRCLEGKQPRTVPGLSRFHSLRCSPAGPREDGGSEGSRLLHPGWVQSCSPLSSWNSLKIQEITWPNIVQEYKKKMTENTNKMKTDSHLGYICHDPVGLDISRTEGQWQPYSAQVLFWKVITAQPQGTGVTAKEPSFFSQFFVSTCI